MGHSAALVSSSSNALSIVTAAVVAISAVSATYHDELFVGEVYGTITAPAVDVVVLRDGREPVCRIVFQHIHVRLSHAEVA